MPQTGSFCFAPEELEAVEAEEDFASGEAPSVTKPDETECEDEIELAPFKYLSGCALNFSAHPLQQK
jgi:hypothetical protein